MVKELERSGVKNILFTDSLKQRDDNIKKVGVKMMGCVTSWPLSHYSLTGQNM